MALTLLSERDQSAIVEALEALTRCKRALHKGDVAEAEWELRAFRGSPIGQTARQLQSDVLELRVQAHRDPSQLCALATSLHARHVGKDNEDSYFCAAAELIRRHRGAREALAWLERTAEPAKLSREGRGQTVALYLSLLRQAGRVDEARALADQALDGRRPGNPHPAFWEQCIATLRGQRADGRDQLRQRLESAVASLPDTQRLRLWNAASASRILVASTTLGLADTVGLADKTDKRKPLRLALTFHRLQATLNAREQRYAQAAEHLRQARELSLQLRGESLETLELSLERFEMLLQAGAVAPTDNAWQTHLRSVAVQVGAVAFMEYRLANVWRRGGQYELAADQYAQVARKFPKDAHGVRAHYQLAVADEEAGALDAAYDRYGAVADAPQTKPSVAMLCRIGAYRCAVKRNDAIRQNKQLEAMGDFAAKLPTVRQALLAVRQLRDAGLGELSDAVLDQCMKRYDVLKRTKPMNPRKYLRLTHALVRRLYAAGRHEELLALVNSIPPDFWSYSEMQWIHLAGCLHYACLSWLALGAADKALETASVGIGPLSERPCQSAHVELAMARVAERTRGWAWAKDIYNRIVANAPFSRAAMKARVQLARRAWDEGRIDEARQWAMAVLIDGKLNRKDPDLDEAYWSAYSMAASKQDSAVDADGLVYPALSGGEAMQRQRRGRVAEKFHLE